MKRKRRKMSTCHVLVIGSKGAGKTCLIHTFFNGEFKQSPRDRGSEVSRKVFTVGCQDIEFEVQEGRGEGEELSAGARLANTVLLCYRASDLMSLHEAVTKWLPLVKRLNPNLPIVLVGCQGDNKVYGTNTMLETDTILDNVNVVMHVETSAATSVKSVSVAFQVAALACFEHKPSEDGGQECCLQPVTYALPNKIKINAKKEKTPEELYANLPGIKREEKDLDVRDFVQNQQTDLLKINTQASNQEAKACKQTKNGVAIECHRLNKNKVLEKINVEVSSEVFEALQQMNPNLTIKNSTKKSWNVFHFDSADFCLGKSLLQVKSLLASLRSWKSVGGAKYSISKQKVTSL